MSTFWQILTSAGVGALITAASSIVILLITQRQTRTLAASSRAHEREMRRLEHNREDARELSGIVQELTIATEQWSSAQRIVGPLLAKMNPDDLMGWIDSDIGRQSYEQSVRIGDLLIRATLLARDDEMRQRVFNATRARDAISSMQHDDAGMLFDLQSHAISSFERSVGSIAYLVAQRQSDDAMHSP